MLGFGGRGMGRLLGIAAQSAATGGGGSSATIYSDGTKDGGLGLYNADNAVVRAATEADSLWAGTGFVSWYIFGADFGNELSFIAIDTSSIPDGATITSVQFKAKRNGIGTTSAGLQVRISPSWAGTPVGTDWLTPAEFAACELVATAAYAETSGVLTFTSEAGFPAEINKTGITYLVIGSAGWAADATTSDDAYTEITLGTAELEADRPHLVIEYTA